MQKNKYQLISISHFFYPIKGGLENMTYNLLTYFAKQGYNSLAVHGGAKENKEYTINSFDVKTFNTTNIFNNTYPIFGIKFFIYNYKLIKNNPDAQILIHARHVTSSFISALVCVLLRKKYYLVEHTANTSFVNSSIAKIVVGIYEKTFSKFVVKKANTIISVSGASKNYLQKTYKVPEDKITIIYNGINEEEMQNFKTDEKEKNVVFSAKFIKVKDPNTTYKAFKTLAKQHPDWTFYFIGQGETLKPEISKTTNLKIINEMIERDSLLKLFAKSKIYINSSLSEAMSLTTLEATFLGNIPVLSDAPSNVEISKIFQTTQFIFKRQNHHELVAKTKLAIQHSENKENLDKMHTVTKDQFNNSKLFKKYEKEIF